VLEKFSSHKGRLVLLISLKAGGVGLNLVAASRVFMLDPWWSFAVEAQAIDRVCIPFCGWGVNGRFIGWDRISRFLLRGLLSRIRWRRRC
jgi:hypothetical protein